MSAGASPFDRRVVVAVVIAGVLAFAAFLWLSAYAPAMRSFDDRGFAPLSKNAVGFAATFALIEAVTGEKVGVLEDNQSLNEPGLVIMPLSIDSNPRAIRAFAKQRASNIEDGATLLILPKWSTKKIAWSRNEWVQRNGIHQGGAWALAMATARTAARIAPAGARFGGALSIHRLVPADPITLDLPQVRKGAMIEPMLTLGNQAVLARITGIEGSPVYLLSDPDLLANHALKTEAGARAAMAIVQAVRPADSRISVDPEPARGGPPRNDRNLLQLMFEPPFLSVTLSILAAALLAALHAFGRFGPALPEPRAIPFGKRALADNAAVLFARAGAVGRLGERYVALTRDAAAQALGATHLAAPALEAWLAGLPRLGGPDFATLAASLREARDADAVRAGAAAMHDWKNEVMRDR